MTTLADEISLDWAVEQCEQAGYLLFESVTDAVISLKLRGAIEQCDCQAPRLSDFQEELGAIRRLGVAKVPAEVVCLLDQLLPGWDR